MLLKFQEYLPDLPAYMGGSVVSNVIPMGEGYEPFNGPLVFSDALTARCQGAFSCRDSDTTIYNFAGDATKLYNLSSAAWNDASKVGGYTTASADRWSFTQYGRRVIACNFTDATQSYVMGSSTDFADLGGSPPKAKYAATIKDFVALANVGGATLYPTRVQWSALGDPTDWAVSAATQSDYQDLDYSKGPITQIVGGEYGVVFQEFGISRMTYVGSPLVFQFDQVETARGTQAPGSVVQAGGMIFYWGYDGFYAFNGSSSIPIGDNKVDKTFLADLNYNYANRISGWLDARRPIVYWAYPSTASSTGDCDSILCYNWVTNRFSPIDLTGSELEMLYGVYSPGFTLEQLATIGYTNLDTIPFSFDDSRLASGQIHLAGFNTSHKLVFLIGDTLAATMDTLEARPNENGRVMVTRVRPIVDTSSATVSVGYRERQADTVTYGTAASQVTDGSCPVRASGAFVRARVSIAAATTWTHAQGVEIEELQPIGKR